ncbi:hypothetical protein B6N42_11565 [Cutibacterium avidum]|nr:hypothetical protein B6N42_11565 [Cutibacterium avidum]PGX63267.1 hypothetical protein B6N41_07340 [Cutibacterium avidum]PGX64293.1 hypothetical protein B6N40_00315 [Cutibacterium avidum]
MGKALVERADGCLVFVQRLFDVLGLDGCVQLGFAFLQRAHGPSGGVVDDAHADGLDEVAQLGLDVASHGLQAFEYLVAVGVGFAVVVGHVDGQAR